MPDSDYSVKYAHDITDLHIDHVVFHSLKHKICLEITKICFIQSLKPLSKHIFQHTDRINDLPEHLEMKEGY